MFIDSLSQFSSQLQRSDMFQTMDQSSARYIPLPRSFRNILPSRIYKHFVRTGLIAWGDSLAQERKSCDPIQRRPI
jgi:hypothetical protein